ncbi:hypothetical protein BDW74DRAFT_88539 [Aspergillus multicolor]|uniref:uncharacterized protein n=1 Tax=Aspergillus multicolor TaxID=41759 RepID=UPI003CCE4E83
MVTVYDQARMSTRAVHVPTSTTAMVPSDPICQRPLPYLTVLPVLVYIRNIKGKRSRASNRISLHINRHLPPDPSRFGSRRSMGPRVASRIRPRLRLYQSTASSSAQRSSTSSPTPRYPVISETQHLSDSPHAENPVSFFSSIADLTKLSTSVCSRGKCRLP